jgi:hypothetical protein
MTEEIFGGEKTKLDIALLRAEIKLRARDKFGITKSAAAPGR